MKEENDNGIIYLMSSTRYLWKVGTTFRTVADRLIELTCKKKRKHKALGYFQLKDLNTCQVEGLAKLIQGEFIKDAKLVGSDYFIKKDNQKNIVEDFKYYMNDICTKLKIEYEWYKC